MTAIGAHQEVQYEVGHHHHRRSRVPDHRGQHGSGQTLSHATQVSGAGGRANAREQDSPHEARHSAEGALPAISTYSRWQWVEVLFPPAFSVYTQAEQADDAACRICSLHDRSSLVENGKETLRIYSFSWVGFDDPNCH
jgi:hypothetical protein